MEAGEEFQTLLADGPLHLSYDVAVWTHARGIPAIDPAVPHREAVCVFGDRPDVPCAGLLEESHPRIWVEVLGGKCGSKVLVTEAIERAVGGKMVIVLRSAGKVHPVGVPFIAEGGDGIESPVKVDTKLGITEPV